MSLPITKGKILPTPVRIGLLVLIGTDSEKARDGFLCVNLRGVPMLTCQGREVVSIKDVTTPMGLLEADSWEWHGSPIVEGIAWTTEPAKRSQFEEWPKA
mgnify:CR=1 FL=1